MKQTKPILLASLAEAVHVIRKNKLLFILLIFTQLIFFIAITAVNANYLTKILAESNNILAKMESIPDPASANPIAVLGGMDFSGVMESYSKIKSYLLLSALFSLASFLLIENISWHLTKRQLKKTAFFPYALKFIAISIIFLIPASLIAYSHFSKGVVSLLDGYVDKGQIAFSIAIISAALYYMIIALSLINKIRLIAAIKKAFITGTKKFHILIPAFLISTALISLFSYLIYLSIEKSMILLISSIFLLLASFVFSRLFIVVLVDKLEKGLR